MTETITLDAELGTELVDYGDADNLLDDSVIAQCREALKWRGVLLIRGAHLDDTTSDVPSRATMLTGRRLSEEGGGTEFANTSAAYDNLPIHERKRYDGLRVVHSFEAAQRKVNPDPTDDELAGWRTAPTHESSLVWKRRDGRRSLVIGATADHVVGDAVLWDNTAVLHRALPYDLTSDRRLRRTHIKGQEAWA